MGADPFDFLGLDQLLSDEERMIRDAVRQFVAERVLPGIEGWFERAEFPAEVFPELGKLGLLGMHLQGYGCAGSNAVSYGLTCLEMEAGDSGFRSAISVQGSLSMFPIWRFGSEEQKAEWLPQMARGDAIGCFGLTEPDAGSNPGSMRTYAKQDAGGDWVLNGSKMWITNGGIADVAIVWARTDDGIRGFVVPTDTAGFSAKDIHRKLSLRASVTSELVLDDELRCDARAKRQLPVDVLRREAGRVRGDDESADAVVGAGPHDGDVGDAAVRDPHLRAVQDPVAAGVLLRVRSHRAGVRPRVRLGEAEAADRIPARHL